MFAGLDKHGGGVVGNMVTDRKFTTITMGESAETASAEETLVGRMTDPDGKSHDVLLRSGVDPQAGGLRWLPVDANVAAQDTTAMSQMTSMLHDNDRNRKYKFAITKAVHSFIQQHGRPPVVLDIGCGTGLLSMLAARAGAEEVYGCEMYEPLAQIAREVSELNCKGKITEAYVRFFDKDVRVIAKKSTDLEVGDEKDLPRRADLCVNEIYDSALLGEGCLPALRHALANLLVEHPIMVPASAINHGVLISSAYLRARHDLSQAEFSDGVPIPRNASAAMCDGGRKALPLQNMEVTDAVELSDSFQALEFDFRDPFPEEGCRSRCLSVRVRRDAVLDGVMMTWDLGLDSETTYSTRPGSENWQDHWCPCFYPVVGNVSVRAGDTVRLKVTHSELHIAFQVLGVSGEQGRAGEAEVKATSTLPVKPSHSSSANPTDCLAVDARSSGGDGISCPTVAVSGYKMEREWDPEPCGCGWHVLCNPERIGMLTDVRRREAYQQALRRVVRRLSRPYSGPPVCLDVSDGATCAFLAVAEGARAAVTYEPAEWSHLLVSQVVGKNNLEDKVFVMESPEELPYLKRVIEGSGCADADGEQPVDILNCDMLMGEPFYYRMHSLVLYEAINFWYLRRRFNSALTPGARIFPLKAIMCVAAVELPELSLSHGPVGSVLGFDHSPYDRRVGPRWHEPLYPYPLKAYKHRMLTRVVDLLFLEYGVLPKDLESGVTLAPEIAGTVHAVVIWVDYQLDDQTRWSTYYGANMVGMDMSSPVFGSGHGKQMLKFLPRPQVVDSSTSKMGQGDRIAVQVRARFNAEEARMDFDAGAVIV